MILEKQMVRAFFSLANLILLFSCNAAFVLNTHTHTRIEIDENYTESTEQCSSKGKYSQRVVLPRDESVSLLFNPTRSDMDRRLLCQRPSTSQTGVQRTILTNELSYARFFSRLNADRESWLYDGLHSSLARDHWLRR